jgi:hypothetical protein
VEPGRDRRIGRRQRQYLEQLAHGFCSGKPIDCCSDSRSTLGIVSRKLPPPRFNSNCPEEIGLRDRSTGNGAATLRPLSERREIHMG